MRTVLHIVCFILSGLTALAQSPYNAEETAKLRKFLLQESAEPGVKNYQQLGIESMDNIEWGHVTGLTWNSRTLSLEVLDWGKKKLSGDMDFSGFRYLQRLYCNFNEIKSVDLTDAVSLRTIDFYINSLEAIDVTTSPGLSFLRLTNNNIKEIDLSNNPELTFICCTGNKVESLDFSNNTKLETVYCIANELSYLNVQNCSKLKELLCSDNHLTELDISNKERLFGFTCARNNLLTLNVVNCPSLLSLDCETNELDTLDLSGCTDLSSVKCDKNRLKAIYLTDCLSLEEFSCGQNLLDSLRLPESPSLHSLNCRNNNLDFHTLPPILPAYTEYIYYPQNDRIAEAVVDSVDFSYYYELDGITSKYDWRDGVRWLHPEEKGGGIFAFDESYVGKKLLCGIENNMFPTLFFRYYVTMKSRDDVANRPLPDTSSAASVYADEGFVHVVTKSPAGVVIYALNGALVYSGNVGEGRTDIPLERGMYVVTICGGAVCKVSVR
ncbi:MAG: hypothetical protein LBS79_05600 [Tannerella sp.]|jgi:hypothetical protein|nr:hypothetical protein [Tannerella sp.]